MFNVPSNDHSLFELPRQLRSELVVHEEASIELRIVAICSLPPIDDQVVDNPKESEDFRGGDIGVECSWKGTCDGSR